MQANQTTKAEQPPPLKKHNRINQNKMSPKMSTKRVLKSKSGNLSLPNAGENPKPAFHANPLNKRETNQKTPPQTTKQFK